MLSKKRFTAVYQKFENLEYLLKCRRDKGKKMREKYFCPHGITFKKNQYQCKDYTLHKKYILNIQNPEKYKNLQKGIVCFARLHGTQNISMSKMSRMPVSVNMINKNIAAKSVMKLVTLAQLV